MAPASPCPGMAPGPPDVRIPLSALEQISAELDVLYAILEGMMAHIGDRTDGAIALQSSANLQYWRIRNKINSLIP